MTAQAFQPPPAERPADRYGDRGPSTRRRVVGTVVIAVLVALALTSWVWLAANRANPSVRYDLLGFEVVTPTSVEIRFSVTREPGVPVLCVVRARGAAGDEVGRLQVLVPTDDRERLDLTRTLRTTGPAVTGEVVTCESYDARAELGRGGRRLPRVEVADLLPWRLPYDVRDARPQAVPVVPQPISTP